jgi:hypothetical protein
MIQIDFNRKTLLVVLVCLAILSLSAPVSGTKYLSVNPRKG